MKQTTLLPHYTPNAKKSPLPIMTKSGNKSPYAKSAVVALTSALSPISKYPIIQEEITETDAQVTPIKPSSKSSKRRSRDSFEGILQPFEKRFKTNTESELKNDEKVSIKISQMAALSSDKQTESNSKSLETAEMSTIASQTPGSLNFSVKKQDMAMNTTSSVVSTSCKSNGLSEIIELPKQEIPLKSELKQNPLQEKSLNIPVKQEKAMGSTKISNETLSIIKNLKAQKEQKKILDNSSNLEVKNNKAMEEEKEDIQISSKASNLIQAIKAKSSLSNQNERLLSVTTDNVQSNIEKSKLAPIDPVRAPSIREKYEELLRSERDFVLPVSYKKLLTVFESLDKAMNFFAVSQKPTFFSILKETVKEMLKIEIATTQLAQIMYIMPTAYTITWEKNDKMKGDTDIYLKFYSDENGSESENKRTLQTQKLDERKTIFKKGLLDITKRHHAEFLKLLGPEEREKNYEQERCWNSKFKVHDCPQIPEAKLPSKPHKEDLKSVQEFLLSSDVKNNRVKQIMEECLKKQEEPVVESAPIVRQNKNIIGISEKILAKVRAREQALAQEAQEKQKNQSTQLHKLMQQELRKVAETLKVYYTQREHLTHNANGLVLGKNEATQYIEEVMKLCPNWLSVQEMGQNRILKMDKSLNMQIVYGKLEAGK